MGSKFAKAAYTGGKAIYDKWFPPEAQEGGEPINDSFYSRDKYTSNASKYRRA